MLRITKKRDPENRSKKTCVCGGHSARDVIDKALALLPSPLRNEPSIYGKLRDLLGYKYPVAKKSDDQVFGKMFLNSQIKSAIIPDIEKGLEVWKENKVITEKE